MTGTRKSLLIVLAAVVALTACSKVVRRTASPAAVSTLDQRSPFLKVHLPDGRLYVLKSWSVDDDARVVTGQGYVYNAGRDRSRAGDFTIPVDSVALFETNVVQRSPSIAPLVIMTGISVSVTIMCAINPKACFGSCPTFYVEDDSGTQSLRAEGFSSSIAPWLEATDADALRITRPGGTRVDVRMTNEALETHVVRRVDLLACPVGEGETAVKDTDGVFHTARAVVPASRCIAPEGDVAPLVAAVDGEERVSLADSTDLATREMLELEFGPVAPGKYGLVVAARQTLLTTWLLYETLSNIGGEVGAWFAAASTAAPDPHLLDALGGIDVLVRHGDSWRAVGTVGEHGPIATDEWVVPLPELGAGFVTIRLRMTKGTWRLDCVTLAELGGAIEPVRIAPDDVTRAGHADVDALAALWAPGGVVTTFPGDELTLGYELPADYERYQLFVESRGYYLEWIRDEWLADENTAAAAEMLFMTDRALVRLAPEFKKVESAMEDAFWGSRYGRP